NARAIQPVFFVRQNLVEGVPGKIGSIVDRVRKIFPRFLTMRALMVGCAAGTGDLAACDEKDEAWVASSLQASLSCYARQNKASLVVLKDFPATYRSKLEMFPANGYARIPSMPMTRLPLPYNNWDEYFRTLSKATRKDLRRKFRKTERAPRLKWRSVGIMALLFTKSNPFYLLFHGLRLLNLKPLRKINFGRSGHRCLTG